MRGVFNHLQYNIANSDKTRSFYRDLLDHFEMQIVYDAGGMLGVSDGNLSFWLLPTADEHKGAAMNRDATGLNHIGFKVDSADDVDEFYTEYMQPRRIEAKWDTPRAREDFGPTYYQVMFEDPEGLAIEVYFA